MKVIRKFLKNESGATAIEYGLIAALVSIAAIGAMSAMGDQLSGAFNDVETAISDGRAGGAPATP